jgi:uncharacterized protein involved in response to NO
MVLDFSESRFQKWRRIFFAQPHQSFFVLGFVVAIYTILQTALFLAFGFSMNFRLFHSINLALFMPLTFFSGFLFTVLYRFLGEIPFLQNQYMRVFWLQLFGVLVFNIGVFISNLFSIIGLVSVLFSTAQALEIFVKKYQTSKLEDKFDPFWIIALFAFSFPSTLLYIFAVFDSVYLNPAIDVTFYIFTIGTVFFVSQKMLPSFYGFYFNIEPKPRQKAAVLIVLASLACIALSNYFSLAFANLLSNLAGFIASFILFFRAGILFKKSKPILSILQVGIFWLLFGFLAGVFATTANVPALQIHIFGAGFLGTLIIGFGTRVTLGHSNQQIIADNITTVIFVVFEVVVVMRLLAFFIPSLLIPSAAGWCVVFALWSVRYMPSLLRIK